LRLPCMVICDVAVLLTRDKHACEMSCGGACRGGTGG
jgi:hypothetical protein